MVEYETIAAMGEGKADSIDNYMDSGCTENVLCPQNHFTSQKKVAPVKVGNIGKEPVIMTRRGTTNIVGTNGRGKPINFELKNSLISETLINKNLISARRIADAGHTIVIGRGAGGASKMRIITGNVKVSGRNHLRINSGRQWSVPDSTAKRRITSP